MVRTPRRRRRRTYLIGVAGHPNFGDEAITRGWLRWLAKHRPHDEVWLDVPNPGGAAALHHREHPYLVTVDTVHRLGWESPVQEVPDVAAHTGAVLQEPGRSARWIAGIEAFTSADTVHVIGGGYVHARHPHTASIPAALSWAVEHGAARTAITGAGLTPSSPELDELYRDLAPRLDVATVRDPGSAAILSGAVLSPDDVWLGGIDQHLRTRRGLSRVAGRRDERIMVLAQGDGHDRHDELTATVVALLEAWDVRPGGYAVVEANPPVDGQIRAALEQRFGPHDFHPFVDVAANGLPAEPGQRWISTRYHPHLLAAAAGARGVAISVSDGYYDVKHRAVTEAGSAWPVIGIGDAPVEPGGAGDLPGRQRQLTDRLAEIAHQVHG